MKTLRSSKLTNNSARELLALHGAIIEELRNRDIVRTSNAPTGDYAETLFRTAFGWKLERNSSAGFDAKDDKGQTFQIKCRRITRYNKSRQLGAIRNMEADSFTHLACALFKEDYSVYRAIIVPRRLLSKMKRRFSKHVNGWLYQLRDDVWDLGGVCDVTAALRRAAGKL